MTDMDRAIRQAAGRLTPQERDEAEGDALRERFQAASVLPPGSERDQALDEVVAAQRERQAAKDAKPLPNFDQGARQSVPVEKSPSEQADEALRAALRERRR